MKALMVRQHGGLDALELVEREKPAIREDEVLVRVEAAGINHLDLWVRKGVPGHKFPLPMILGCDGAGEVVEAGGLVRTVQPGDRVAISPGYSCGVCAVCLDGDQQLCRHYGIFGEMRDGTEAEFVAVPERNLLPLPEGMSAADAAASPLSALTAHHMLLRRARLQAGQDVLVHAAGSGVSVFAIQIAKAYGARVFATASSDAKLERARELGADATINYETEDFSRKVWELTGKRGVDIAIDHVGEATISRSLRCLTKGGALVTCGSTSGAKLEADLRLVFFKNLSILGSTMGGLGEMRQVWRMVERGLIRPVVDRTLPLSRAKEAHAAIEARETFGKIVLIPGE